MDRLALQSRSNCHLVHSSSLRVALCSLFSSSRQSSNWRKTCAREEGNGNGIREQFENFHSKPDKLLPVSRPMICKYFFIANFFNDSISFSPPSFLFFVDIKRGKYHETSIHVDIFKTVTDTKFQMYRLPIPPPMFYKYWKQVFTIPSDRRIYLPSKKKYIYDSLIHFST